jgi:hypothetical protein
VTTFLTKLKSRKFLTVAGGIISLGITAATGNATWAEVAWPIAVLILGYLGVEGAIDYRAVAINPPPTIPGLRVDQHSDDAAIVTVEVAPGAALALSAGKGRATTVTLNGKPIDKLQFPKDFLGLLAGALRR